MRRRESERHPWPPQAWQVGGTGKVCLDLRWLAILASRA
jgi:hypothetical protein